jgi:hypothetical protein
VPQPTAASDSLCAGTVLDGNYLNGLESRLVSPPVQLGSALASLRMCFDSWYRIAGDDVAKVQIARRSAGVWEPWADLAGQFTGDSGGWTPFCIDDALIPYAGELVRFAFYFATGRCLGCGATEDLGWYVDNIQVRGATTDIGGGEVPGGAPLRMRLHQNLPNPFNPSTTIAFDIAAAGVAELAVFDVAGRRVCTLLHGMLPAGTHRVLWDGRDAAGHAAGSGLYLYRLRTASGSLTQRMALVR